MSTGLTKERASKIKNELVAFAKKNGMTLGNKQDTTRTKKSGKR